MSMGEDFHGIIQSLGWECMWFPLWYKIVKVLKSNKILQYGMNNFHGNHMYNLQIGIFFCFVKTYDFLVLIDWDFGWELIFTIFC